MHPTYLFLMFALATWGLFVVTPSRGWAGVLACTIAIGGTLCMAKLITMVIVS